MSPRSRDQILANLEAIYREAYDRAKTAADAARMHDLDAAFQREQLILEVLMDIRDTVMAEGGPKAASPLEQLDAIRRIAKPR